MFLLKINLRELKLYRLIKYPRCSVQSNISQIAVKKMRFPIFPQFARQIEIRAEAKPGTNSFIVYWIQ